MFDSNQFFGGERGFYPLEIEQSLRLNDNDSAYLSRTPASAGNRKTWTWSAWVKRGNLGSTVQIFSQRTLADDYGLIYFDSSDRLTFEFKVSGSFFILKTSQVFRDPSAWYHIVFEVDTTQSTASDREKLYINGTQVTNFNTENYLNQNADTSINTANAHDIGRQLTTQYFDGYLAEVHFTDGTAYDADAFGELQLHSQ